MATTTQSASSIDGVLVDWGDRLFYPGIRQRRGHEAPRLKGRSLHEHADAVRARIQGLLGRSPQVMVKVTGGGRGMRAIVAHLRYIGKNGRLPMEDEQGRVEEGRDAVREIAEAWRWGGSPIPEHSPRREAFNLMLSMPRGSASAEQVHLAARAFAQREFAEHTWVMVLHDHQANPHVHLSVRAESRKGRRLNPRKADLHRWREGFAHELRVLGVEAEATRQAVRGQLRRHEALWQIKAKADGRLRRPAAAGMATVGNISRGLDTKDAWRQISLALRQSERAEDVNLARAMEDLVEGRMSPTATPRSAHPQPVR